MDYLQRLLVKDLLWKIGTNLIRHMCRCIRAHGPCYVWLFSLGEVTSLFWNLVSSSVKWGTGEDNLSESLKFQQL